MLADLKDIPMDNFFAHLPSDAAQRIDGLSRLSYELRENHARLLRPHAVADEDALLRDVVAGSTPEHPAYEHVLGARTLRRTREAVRGDLRSLLDDLAAQASASSVPVDLALLLEAHCEAELEGPVRVHQDALLATLINGVTLEARFGESGEYAFAWRWGEAELHIDTAPLHPTLATFPNHLHDDTGTLRADPATDPARSPWENLRALVEALIANPLLRSRE